MAARYLTLAELADGIRARLGTAPDTRGAEAHVAEFDSLASGLVELLLDGEGEGAEEPLQIWHLLHDRLAGRSLAEMAAAESPQGAALFAERLNRFCRHISELRKAFEPGRGWEAIFPGRPLQAIRLHLDRGDPVDLIIPLHRIRRQPDGSIAVVGLRFCGGPIDLPSCIELAVLWKLVSGALPEAKIVGIVESYLPEREEVTVDLGDLAQIFERFAIPAIEEAAGAAEAAADADSDDEAERFEDQAGLLTNAPLNGVSRVVGPDGPAGTEIARNLKNALHLQGIHVSLDGYSPGPQITRFHVQAKKREERVRIKASAEILQEAFQLIRPPLIFDREDGVDIDLPRRLPRAVTLDSLIREEGVPEPGHPLAFYLGIEPGNLPLVADLAAKGSAHILASGVSGSGKSQFLRCAVACLARCNPPGSISFSLLDPGGGGFSRLSAPALHLAGSVAREDEEAMEILAGAASAISERREQLEAEGFATIRERWRHGRTDLRHEIVAIDEIAPLAGRASRFAKEFERHVGRILAEGREVGIHLLMATRGEDLKSLPKGLILSVPLRLAFQAATPAESKYFLGSEGAERLLGRGDFLFMREGRPCRAQSPVIADQRLIEILSK